ncbi:MAG: hypothetical protein V4722_00280 [Bacteroidota bacterium]
MNNKTLLKTLSVVMIALAFSCGSSETETTTTTGSDTLRSAPVLDTLKVKDTTGEKKDSGTRDRDPGAIKVPPPENN